jgi:cellobiose phosphorylase
MYRIWVEDVLGFRLRGDRLTIDPSLPDDWPGFELKYRYRSTLYEISVRRRPGEKGKPYSFQLVDDRGKHEITVWLPAAQPDNTEVFSLSGAAPKLLVN